MRVHVRNFAILFCLFVLSGCGQSQDNGDMLQPAEMQETDFEESEHQEVSEDEGGGIDVSISEPETPQEILAEEKGAMWIYVGDRDRIAVSEDFSISDILQEIPVEENDVIEIYAGDRDRIVVPEDVMIAQVSPQEILKGNPVIYDRFKTDGWVFEWLISDYYDDDNWFYEDGVLVVSHESDAEDTQIIHVVAEGGDAVWVSAKNKFEYVDVNFDDVPDLLICTGHHGNSGLLTYYCFLQTEDGFVESPTFTDIPNPAIDADNQLILSQWRNYAVSHSWAEFQYQDDTYVMIRELCEDAIWESGDSASDNLVWIWTVNGEEIGRSDKLSEEEIDDLIYNENSEWQISGDRWRTLYNNGLTTDFSIYEEPVVSDQEEQTGPRDYYEELIADARGCIEGKVEEDPEEYYDFSYIIYWYGAYYGASMRLGYLIEDIDGNGTDELIFGQNDDPDSAWNGVIYDLYTISDGELVHVFSGGERARYILCENGMIAFEGADGADISEFAYYIFEGTEIHLVEAVLFNGWVDRDNPWFYSTQTDSAYDTENAESVSEEQARGIMEKYIFEHPVFIPFVEE